MNEPELRFKADDGSEFPEWEEIRIKNIFDITRGYVLAADLTADCPDKINQYPVYSSQTKDNGLMGYYSEYLYENAITWTTDGANAGTVKYRKGKFYCTNVCGVLLNKEGYANQCVAEILGAVSKHYVSYVGNPKLMNNVMADISIQVPSSLEEQQKIADFFSTLDNVINSVQKEVDSWEQRKRGVMQKLFNQEVRFKADDESEFPEWEERPLSGITEIYDGVHQTPNYKDSGIKFVSVEDISSIDSSNKYISEEDYRRDFKIKPECGDILMTRIGSIGQVALIETTDDIAYYVSLALIKCKSVQSDYLYQFIQSDFFQKELWKHTLHEAYPQKINKGDIGLCMVKVPCIAEQKRIADCLSEFDLVIEKTKQKLEAYKQLKKGLMQRMFA